ncbi:leukotriene B4 receptor 1-like [Colossoma macropomum]|uniref:leukotriene B4 receptor 1-like n=1 Tax=Colossoma macropomum TaxID=42526 RepID=UPI0018652270|nr:leukotriene B4 receptor 1-like [Colossoma macropomum]
MQLSNSSDLSSTGLSQANLVSSVLMGFFCAVGVPGNIAVIVIIVLWFKKDNFTVHLMLNLAASDILCLMTLPVWMYNQLHVWMIGRSLCKFISSLAYGSVYSSLLTVTLMSVHRCLQICFPEIWAKLGKTGERFLLFMIWACGFAFSVPAILTQEIVQRDSKRECGRITSSDENRLIVAVLETLLAFVLPCSIMVISYYCLHKRVTQKALIRSRRLTKLVTRIVVTFFIFWTPYHILNLVEIFAICLKQSHPDSSGKVLAFTASLGDIAGSFTFINSCVNPLLYAFASRSLRHGTETENTNIVQTSSI